MTIARRLNETVQFSLISFAACYATAGLIGLLSLSERIGWMLLVLFGFVVSLLLTMWLLSRYAYAMFAKSGADEAALQYTQRRMWSICLLLGLSSVAAAWWSGFRYLT